MNIYHLAILLLFQFSFPLSSPFPQIRETRETQQDQIIADSVKQIKCIDNQQAQILPYNQLDLILPTNQQVQIQPDNLQQNLPNSFSAENPSNAKTANFLFKSSDGGETWQNISVGLPSNFGEDDAQREGYIANDRAFYVVAGNEIYHVPTDSKTLAWKKESFPDKQNQLAASKTGIIAYNFSGNFLQKTDGSNKWLPLYPDFKGWEVRTIFETAGGTVFIGANNQLFKSTDKGKTWKAIPSGGLVGKMVESNGVLIGGGQQGIIRSTDDGETWKWVIREGGVGIDVQTIKGGFAVISYDPKSNSRRIRASWDGGNSWQAIDAGLPPDLSISTIIEVGDDFFCGHPQGIFKSSDKGKTWKLLLPSVDGKVFNLSVSGNVIYAIPRSGGC